MKVSEAFRCGGVGGYASAKDVGFCLMATTHCVNYSKTTEPQSPGARTVTMCHPQDPSQV